MSSYLNSLHVLILVDLKRLLSEQETEIKKLEEECSSVNQKFSKDPEFVRFVYYIVIINYLSRHVYL